MTKHPKLQLVNRIVLQAGHGGQAGERFDPGAIGPNGETENAEVLQIIGRLVPKLHRAGLPVLLLPDKRLPGAIQDVNTYCTANDWVLELHKDSTTQMHAGLVRRMGVYYLGGDTGSAAVAHELIEAFAVAGCRNAWRRPDTAHRDSRLAWLRNTRPVAHLIECGFMQDDLSDHADEFFAHAIFTAIRHCLRIA